LLTYGYLLASALAVFMEFGKLKQNRHLKPLTNTNKDKLLVEISNIEESFTGRSDGNIANTFIHEAS
jgi:hypothetical protein